MRDKKMTSILEKLGSDYDENGVPYWAESEIRAKVADEIMARHDVTTSNHCRRGDCDHVEDAEIARGEEL